MRISISMIYLAVGLWSCLAGCQCNRERPRAFTMLHDAALRGDKAEVENWLSKGDDVNAIDKLGRTPLCLAAQHGHKEIAEILTAHGADVNDGSLAYAVAARQQGLVEFLLSKGARPGGDPLVQAANDKNLDMVRLLISRGADVNARGVNAVSGEPGMKPYGSYGNTPLYIASAGGDADLVKLLIENKADVNIKSRDGYPLGAAAVMGHKEIVEVLLSHGAKIDAKNDVGKTAANLADEQGHKDVGDIIRSKGSK